MHHQSLTLIITVAITCILAMFIQSEAQIYGVEYDATSLPTNCTATPLRIWSYDSASNCALAPAVYGKLGWSYPTIHMNSTCNRDNRGGVFVEFCFTNTCLANSGECQGVGGLSGQCNNNGRYYCGPPPVSVLFPDPSVPRGFMRYGEFMDSACTIPYWLNPFNQTKLNCYQRYLFTKERAVCSADGTNVTFTYWTVPDDPAWSCDMEGVPTGTTTVAVGQCVQDPNIKDGTTRYILVNQCIAPGSQSNSALTYTVNFIVLLSTIIAFLVSQ